MSDIFDHYSHSRPDRRPIIYAYSDIRYPGCLKVGYTTRSIEERMSEHYPTITPTISYKVELVESAMYANGTTFSDHDVHNVLKRKHIQQVAGEWFHCSVNDVRAAIIAIKNHTLNVENRTNTFKMRPEQVEAVRKTKDYFERERKLNPSHTPKFLWNAKMRFGKTFATYELAKSMNCKRVLILTFKPAVESAWEEDLMTHVDFEGWQFFSRDKSVHNGIRPDDLNQKKPIVCFGSFQDYLGTNESGGIKAKNEWVHTTNWDLVVFDEYHYGAWRENAKKLFDQDDEDSYDNLDIEKYKKEEAGNAYNESFLPITTKYYLFLSGTPFRALNSGEFIEEQIYNWTYSDEQKAKDNWQGPDNPYDSMPKMVLMTYKMPDSIRKVAYNSDTNEFDLNVFFSAKSDTGHTCDAKFVYKEYVQKWLDLIRGAYLPSTIDDIKLGQSKKPVMPYSDVRMLNVLTHTFWFLPSVASCYAMKNLLDERQNTFYHDYTINVCAGSEAGIGLSALEPVKRSMHDPLKTKSITLSCGKLTTGVTVKPWTGIFMLRNLKSPETYFQAAFRVQSPWTITKEDGSKEVMKHECYVFDFALDRALRQISDYSCRLNINETNPERKVGEFINFLPVLAYDGSTMKVVDATEILDITMAGTSATLLARRWESALLVNVDNDTLAKLMANEKAMQALMSIEGFRSLNSDIQTIINKSEAVKDAKKKGDKLTKKEKKALSDDEKEYKLKRKQIQEKLIKFATRIPIFMYLTDFREYCLKDVITQFEPELFKKVTGLNINDFNLLVSLGVFNDALMNEAVYKFKRYEDSSLEYTGIRKHADNEDVGLFSTVISREDYEAMSAQQNSSMAAPTVKETVTNKVELVVAPTKPEKQITFRSSSKPSSVNIKVKDLVFHNKFGKGTIIRKKDDVIRVKFSSGEKNFTYPNAFTDGWLKKLDD